MKTLLSLIIIATSFLSTGQTIKSITEIYYDADFNEVQKEEKTFDLSGNLISQKSYYIKERENPMFISMGSHTATFENGRMRYFELFDNDGDLLYFEEYTKSDSVERSQHYTDSSKTSFYGFYDEKMYYYRHYNQLNQLIRLSNKNSILDITYNENGQTLTETTKEGVDIISFYNYTYDEKGNLTSLTTKNGTTVFKYLEFNEKGDWIKQQATYDFEEKKVTTVARQIIYY